VLLALAPGPDKPATASNAGAKDRVVPVGVLWLRRSDCPGVNSGEGSGIIHMDGRGCWCCTCCAGNSTQTSAMAPGLWQAQWTTSMHWHSHSSLYGAVLVAGFAAPCVGPGGN
jgi:hypothetical protein